MKKIPALVAVSGLAMLLSSLGQVGHADNYIDAPRAVPVNFESAGRTTLVAAGADSSVRDLARLSDGRRVRLNGMVESVRNAHDFTLRDDTGKIDVKISSAHPNAIAPGDEVTVAGRINRGLIGATIEASIITTHKATEASFDKPGKHALNMPAYNVQGLPETGVVKVSGTVTTSDNQREFVLKDDTGLVDVNVPAEDAGHVLKGAHVTVVGTVDRGILGKDITATAVIVEHVRVVASAE